MSKKYAAVIVETRNLPNLKEIIVDNHLSCLPGWWELVIFGSGNFTKKLKKELESYTSKLTFIEIGYPLNTADYNKLLTSNRFWDILKEYEKVLIFQHDSKLLRKGIEEFLHWDYVGAPWTFQEYGGNGGLSVRSPKKMLHVLQDFKYNYPADGNEDLFVSNILHRENNLEYGLLAPREVCEKFSCEAIFKLGTLGYHAIDKYLTKEQCEQIENQYIMPENKKKYDLSQESQNKARTTTAPTESIFANLDKFEVSETTPPEESPLLKNSAKDTKHEYESLSSQEYDKFSKPVFKDHEMRYIDKPEKGSLLDLGITGQGIARTYLDEEEKAKEVKETTILEKMYSEMCETRKLLQLLVRKEKQGSGKGLFNDEEELIANTGKEVIVNVSGMYSNKPLVVNLPATSSKTEVQVTLGRQSPKPSQETIDKARQEISLMYKQSCEKLSDINEHLPTLREYAEGLECIEMGTRDVVSSWAFLDSAKKLICYDIVKHPNVADLINLATEADKDFEFIENDVLKVEIPECDLLFIDTLHIYNQLKAELALHGNKARKYLIFHDTISYGNTNEPNADWIPEAAKVNYKTEDKQGLMPAIMEFLDANEQWSVCENFTNNNGLLILKRLS